MWRSPIAQHVAFQEVLVDALRYREAKAGVPKARSAPVSKLQKPGSPLERAPDSDHTLTALDKRLSKTGNVKDARDLLVALRQRRG